MSIQVILLFAVLIAVAVFFGSQKSKVKRYGCGRCPRYGPACSDCGMNRSRR